MPDEKTPTYAGFTADQWRRALGLVGDRASVDDFVAAMFEAVDAGGNAWSVAPRTLALFLFVNDDCRSRLRALLDGYPPAVAAAVEQEAQALEAQGLRRHV